MAVSWQSVMAATGRILLSAHTSPAQDCADQPTTAIEQLLIRYCHAVDQRDWDAYRAVYTADAVRTPDGWRISKRVEQDYFHNMPPDFSFD